MKNWNRTGKIKALILGLCFLPNIIAATDYRMGWSLIMPMVAFVFGTLGLPFLTKIMAVILEQVLERPSWNDNPLNLKRPLRLLHFLALFFLVWGTGILIGAGIHLQAVQVYGLAYACLGAGMLIGIWLTVKLTGTATRVSEA